MSAVAKMSESARNLPMTKALRGTGWAKSSGHSWLSARALFTPRSSAKSETK